MKETKVLSFNQSNIIEEKEKKEHSVSDILNLGSEIFLFKTLLFTANKDKDIIEKILLNISDNDFYDYRLKNLYFAILHCYQKFEYIDVIEIFKLVKSNTVDYLGVDGNLLHLINNSILNVQDINLDVHIHNVKENGRKYQLINKIEEILKKKNQYNSDEIGVYLYDFIKKNIISSPLNKGEAKYVTTAEIINTVLNNYASQIDKNISVPTYFNKIDELLTGFRKGEYNILAGRPSLGKTAFAMTAAIMQAQNNYHVVFFSSEMSENSLGERIISMLSGINIKTLRKYGITDDHAEKLKNANIKNLQIDFVFNQKTIEDIKKSVYHIHHQNAIDIIYIDYLQLLNTEKTKELKLDRNRELSIISQEIKRISHDYNISVVALSQLNRDIERENRPPRLSDLRDSGSIEADADLVCFLHKEKKKNNDNVTTISQISSTQSDYSTKFIVAKGRNIGTGEVTLFWSPDFMKFVE